MSIKTLLEASYLRTGDQYHYSRQNLSGRAPNCLHNHDYFEVFWVLEGHPIHCVGGGVVTLKPRQMIFIRPADAHGLFSAEGEVCSIANLLVPPQIVAHLISRYSVELLDRFFWSQSQLPECYDLAAGHFRAIEDLAASLDNKSHSLAALEAFLLVTLSQLGATAPPQLQGVPAWLGIALREASKPEIFREGTAAFVRVCGRTNEHVTRQTRRLLGLTPSEIIANSRMEYASKALRTTNKTISAISQECGIENESHFYSLFRRHFATTPKLYRGGGQGSPIQP